MSIEAIVTKALGEKAQKNKEDRQAFLRRLATTANGMWFDKEEDGTDIDPTEEADEIWEKMGKTDEGEEAQKWINAAVEVDNEDEIPDFPDIDASEEEAEDEAGNEAGDDETENEDETMLARNEETETETKGTKKKPAAKKAAAKATKAPVKKAAAEKPAPKKAAKKEDKTPAKKAAKPANKKTGRKEGGPSGYTTIRAIMRDNMSLKLPELITKLETKGYKLSRNAVSVIRANFMQTCAELQAAGCLKNLKLPG